MTAGDRARAVSRWLAARTPRQILCTGWVMFFLGCYPGYMTTESVLQLYTVRSGDYTDYSPVMTAIWGALEYVSAGPFPMLVLQSGLFLFGTYALLARRLSPRAAALTAAGILLFPPVFTTFAVIWPDPLMAAMLIAGFAAALDPRRNWKIAGAVMGAIALACRPEITLAVIPLALVAVGPRIWWQRIALALAVVLGLALAARGADAVLTVQDTYFWQQQLEVMDTVGTIRRSQLKKVEVLEAAFAGMPFADIRELKPRVTASTDALSWWPLSNGDKRIFDRITIDAESRALSRNWRDAITKHSRGYLRHRKAMAKTLIGLGASFAPVWDSFGDPGLMQPLHHRASSSDWQRGWQAIVRAVGATPLMRPWLYLLLAIVAIVLARRDAMLRALAIAGLTYEISLFVLAPVTEYRYSHLLVTTTTLVLVALAVARRWAARATDG